MSQLPDNSNANKPPAPKDKAKKKVEKVVVGDVVTKKRGLGKRFKETFIQGDSKSVWAYVFYDVLQPAAKDTFENMVGEGLHRMLHGNTPRPMTRAMGGGVVGALGRQVYGQAFQSPFGTPGGRNDPRQQQQNQLSRQARATHDFKQIIFPSRGDAEVVFSGMVNLINLYQEATVRDLYDLSGLTPTFADEKYGWVALDGTDIQRLRGGAGYVLDLPPAIPLD